MSTVFNKAGETPWYVQLFFPLLLGLGQFPAQQILAIGPLTVLYPLSTLFAPWLSASFARCEMLQCRTRDWQSSYLENYFLTQDIITKSTGVNVSFRKTFGYTLFTKVVLVLWLYEAWKRGSLWEEKWANMKTNNLFDKIKDI